MLTVLIQNSWLYVCELCTLTGPAVSRDGEASGTGTVVGAHGVVAGMRTGVPDLTLILIYGT